MIQLQGYYTVVVFEIKGVEFPLLNVAITAFAGSECENEFEFCRNAWRECTKKGCIFQYKMIHTCLTGEYMRDAFCTFYVF